MYLQKTFPFVVLKIYPDKDNNLPRHYKSVGLIYNNLIFGVNPGFSPWQYRCISLVSGDISIL